jgi:hypothetical protein
VTVDAPRPAKTLLRAGGVALEDRPMTKSTSLLVAASTALALSLTVPTTAHAQVGGARRFGLGLALGYPDVGLSANYFTSATTSLQFVASFWYRYGRFGHDYVDNSSGIFLRADYLFHPTVLVRGSTADLGFYVGPGVYAGFGNYDSFAFGLELPIGLVVQFKGVPLDLAFEAVPRLGILDGNGVGLGFGIGGTFHIRFYF